MNVSNRNVTQRQKLDYYCTGTNTQTDGEFYNEMNGIYGIDWPTPTVMWDTYVTAHPIWLTFAARGKAAEESHKC